jgi:hypothetical protein
MDSKLFFLLCDIEDYLINYIESDDSYIDEETIEEYFNRKEPSLSALYHAFKKLSDKFFPEEANN